VGDASDISFVAPIKPQLLPAHGAYGQPAHQGPLRRPAGDEDGRDHHCDAADLLAQKRPSLVMKPAIVRLPRPWRFSWLSARMVQICR